MHSQCIDMETGAACRAKFRFMDALAISTAYFKGMKHMGKKWAAETIGTFWLVLGGCGSAVFAADVIGIAGVSLAFGLTVLTMAFAIGHISGCHLNPAVSLGLWAGGRFPGKDLAGYIISQLIGAIIAGTVILIIAQGRAGFEPGGTFAANGFGELSPGNFSMGAAFICEVVMTFIFLIIIIGATDKRAPQGLAPIAIGLALALIHLISIPVTNTSVNPARSTSQALFAGAAYIQQLWLFWLAPIIGAILAGFCYRSVFEQKSK